MDKRLLKIVELATRGIKGERENAERIARRELGKLGLTMDQYLNETKTKMRDFKYSTGIENKLIAQIIASVIIDAEMYETRKNGKLLKSTSVKCTDAEYAEIATKYDILRKDLKNEVKTFFRAFVMKNNLFSKNTINKEPTPAEIRNNEKAMEMAVGIDRSKIFKQIP